LKGEVWIKRRRMNLKENNGLKGEGCVEKRRMD